MSTLHIEKDVPVVGEYDLVVCGGGPAGFIAAIAGAREGLKVALVERYGFLGGMASAGYVAPISVFTYNGELVIGGIPWEFVHALEKDGGAYIERPLGNIAFDIEKYKLTAQRMTLDAGVELYMHSYLSGCVCKDGVIDCVTIENKNGTEALRAKTFIDATGDADLAYMAGVPMQPMGDAPLQPASMYFTLAGVDTSSPLIFDAMHHNKQGVNCQCMPIREELTRLSEELNIPDFGGPWFCTLLHDGRVAVNMTRAAANVIDNRDFTRAECKLREDVYRMADILRERFPEFKNCYVDSVATQAGPRESRRIKGVYTVKAEEYLNAYKYEDSISRGAHLIDIHATHGATQETHFLKNAAYVPYRALIAEDFPNLLVAGRCLSADRGAFAALRVQASCMGMGQAAGVAAGLCVKAGVPVQNADVPALIARLRDMGTKI